MLFLCVFALACNKDEDNIKVLPDCIEAEIEILMDFGQGSATKYKFQGMDVYLLCDGMCFTCEHTQVLDQACKQVCLMGGIVGEMDCVGVNFLENAKELEVLWEAQ